MPSLLRFLSADSLSTSNPDLITISFFICLQNCLKPQSGLTEQKKGKKDLIPQSSTILRKGAGSQAGLRTLYTVEIIRERANLSALILQLSVKLRVPLQEHEIMETR